MKGTPLESWRNRHVDEIAWFIMRNAAHVLEERFRQFSAATERVA